MENPVFQGTWVFVADFLLNYQTQVSRISSHDHFSSFFDFGPLFLTFSPVWYPQTHFLLLSLEQKLGLFITAIFFFLFFFFFLPCSNKWQNQWCTVIQQCNSFHWLWLLARSAICLWLSLSPSLSLSLSFAWICPTFRNITCLPSLSYARGTTPVSPPFRRGVLWVRQHLGYSTSVSWEEKGRKKSKRIHAKKKKIDIYIMFWDPIAPASAFYPKPWDGSASSRNFSCFVRASSFSLSDTGTPRQCTAPWNACCWTLAGLCHQTTSCIGNRGTPLGSYACLLFEAAEKWIIN